MTLEGRHFKVLGYSEEEGGKTIVNITSLPEELPSILNDPQAGTISPFDPIPANASLFESIKIVFFRLSTDRDTISTIFEAAGDKIIANTESLLEFLRNTSDN